LLVILALLADQVWKRRPKVKSASIRAGAAAFAIYVMLMIANFGEFEAGFLLRILWRGLLAGALMTGAAAVVISVVVVLLDEPLTWVRSQIRTAVYSVRRERDDRRQRELDAARAAAALERERLFAPEREKARRAAEGDARRRHDLERLRDRLRYDLSLDFKRIRKLDPEILTSDEFTAHLEHALVPNDHTEIDRRVAALRDVFAAVLSNAPKTHTFQSLAQEFIDRHADIDRSPYPDEIKDKLHRWVNLQGEHEIEHLRRRQHQ
jgi:hypothetical protein